MGPTKSFELKGDSSYRDSSYGEFTVSKYFLIHNSDSIGFPLKIHTIRERVNTIGLGTKCVNASGNRLKDVYAKNINKRI